MESLFDDDYVDVSEFNDESLHNLPCGRRLGVGMSVLKMSGLVCRGLVAKPDISPDL